MHRGFPQDQDSGEVPGEEVHVAGGPAEEVPPLRQDWRSGSRRVQHQFTRFFDPLYSRDGNLLSINCPEERHRYASRSKACTEANKEKKKKKIKDCFLVCVHVSVSVSAYCMYCKYVYF